jgi:hypothetical protein
MEKFSLDFMSNVKICRVIKRFGWPKSFIINVKLIFVVVFKSLRNIRPVKRSISILFVNVSSISYSIEGGIKLIWLFNNISGS